MLVSGCLLQIVREVGACRLIHGRLKSLNHGEKLEKFEFFDSYIDSAFSFLKLLDFQCLYLEFSSTILLFFVVCLLYSLLCELLQKFFFFKVNFGYGFG